MPLATKLRPVVLTDFLGQEHLVGSDGIIKNLINVGHIPSMIFWGPPASGKTTLAEIIASTTNADFIRLSAVMDGKSDLKKVLVRAKGNKIKGISTILFIDEIHRWSKSQQDVLLPSVETGEIILIGATTENPSFTVISPLLSRSRVILFKSPTVHDITKMLHKGLNYLNATCNEDDLTFLAELSNSDIRFALNSLEIAYKLSPNNIITRDLIERSIQKFLRYDKNGEEHYNIISAMHKSLRSSNASAAIYWIMRMLNSGEDPLYIARRMLRFASEDIGNINPNALLLANVVYETCHKLGAPECDTALVQLAEYLAHSKKSNKSYIASQKAKKDIEQYGNLGVPLHFRNAPTKLMKDFGYSKNYEYDHDLVSKKSDQQCLPDKIKDRNYFN